MPNPLATLFKRVYLGGVINEAVVRTTITNDGLPVAYVTAIDMANQIFVDVSVPVDLADIGDFGVGNLGILTKFFETHSDKHIDIVRDANRLILKAGQHGELRYLLSEIDLIPTDVDNTEEMSARLDAVKFTLSLTQQTVNDLLNYLSWLRPEYVSFNYEPDNGMVIIDGGKQSEHQFEIEMGVVLNENKGIEPFSIPINAVKLAAVLNVLEWDDNYQPEMLFGEDEAVIVTIDDENYWAIIPQQVVE